MQAYPGRLGVNTNVVHETIDGEAIIIHLVSGNYYSLDGCGPEVWTALEGHATVAEIVNALGNAYDAPAEEIERAVMRLVDELRAEDLVVAFDQDGERSFGAAATATIERQPFQAPRLGKYTDMQDLVRLDPVHEVDAAGWPHPRAAADALERQG